MSAADFSDSSVGAWVRGQFCSALHPTLYMLCTGSTAPLSMHRLARHPISPSQPPTLQRRGTSMCVPPCSAACGIKACHTRKGVYSGCSRTPTAADGADIRTRRRPLTCPQTPQMSPALRQSHRRRPRGRRCCRVRTCLWGAGHSALQAYITVNNDSQSSKRWLTVQLMAVHLHIHSLYSSRCTLRAAQTAHRAPHSLTPTCLGPACSFGTARLR
jgi:hypothetical protein